MRQPLNITRVKEASSISAPEKSPPSTRTSTRRSRLRSAAVNDEWTMCESSTDRPSRAPSEKSPWMVMPSISAPAVRRRSGSNGRSGGRRGAVGRSLLRRVIRLRIRAATRVPRYAHDKCRRRGRPDRVRTCRARCIGDSPTQPKLARLNAKSGRPISCARHRRLNPAPNRQRRHTWLSAEN
jgi:hypothetical protein